jgi:RNA polymerase sigma-70 factor (ECF subfamily)
VNGPGRRDEGLPSRPRAAHGDRPRVGSGVAAWSDEQLVAAALEPDARQVATTEIFRRHSPFVMRMLRRGMGRHVTDVQDVTQEVFLRLFVRLDAIDNPAALRAFIAATTVNVMKWQLRKRAVRSFVRLSPRGEDVDLAIEGLDDEAREAYRRFDRVLRTLGTEGRAWFLLRHLERLTVAELAQVMRVSRATAKRRLEHLSARVNDGIAADPMLAGYSLRRVKQGSGR